MQAMMFENFRTVISQRCHNTGSIGDFCLKPFLFLATVIDCRKGRRDCWGRSLSLAKLLSVMPRQLKVLSEASLPGLPSLVREI